MVNKPTITILILFIITALFYIAIASYITYPMTTILKPIPILLLIVAVWQSSVLEQYKRLLILALGFSALGDIMLTLPIQLSLELGIGFFMVAHGCYIALFLKNDVFQVRQTIYFLPVLIVSVFVFFYLRPYAGELFLPVSIYICVLTAMVFCAFQSKQNTVLLASGALIFMLSDLILALNQFVFPGSYIRLLIMPAYYLAQCLLVLGVISLGRENNCAVNAVCQ